MSLERRAVERIVREFSDKERDKVIQLLNSYAGPEIGRVTWDILQLSNGSLEQVKHYAAVAHRDYRDILYWAEYYDNDPMVRGRDPKQIVDEIVSRWENKK